MTAPDELTRILRRIRLVVLAAVALPFVTAIALLLPHRSYTAGFTFAPQAPDARGGQLSGIAAQLGLSLSTGQVSQSPDFFVDLLTSRRILDGLADTPCRVATAEGPRDTSFADYFSISEANPAKRLEKVVRQLRGHIDVATQRKSGIVSVAVHLKIADLSLCLARRTLELLNQVNTTVRQTQAGAQRFFLERRVADAGVELHAAEERLLGFLRGNRDFTNSPELVFERGRLQREVDMAQQVFTSLRQSLEQSRIEEVRDTPVISVIDPPAASPLPDSRGIVRKCAIAMIAGLGIGVLLALYWDSLAAAFGLLRRRLRTG